MNTIERHHKQVISTLRHLTKAKFTSGEVLQMVAERERRGLPAQLERLGLILRRNPFGNTYIFGLSQVGADLMGVEKFDIHKVSWITIKHSLVAQSETLLAIKDFGIEDYQFERQKYLNDTRPDVVWETKNGTYFVEVELNGKQIINGELDRFFLKIVSRQTIVIFKDPTLADRYLNYARKYAKTGIPNWLKLEGQWIKFDDYVPVTPEQWNRITFKIVKQPMKFTLYDMMMG